MNNQTTISGKTLSQLVCSLIKPILSFLGYSKKSNSIRAGVVTQLTTGLQGRHSQKTIEMAKKAASGESKHGKKLHTHTHTNYEENILQIMNSHYDRVVLHCVCGLHNVSRLALSSVDMEQRDYDLRTALHVAAAEGEAVQKEAPPLTSRFTQCLPACRKIQKK